MFYIHTHVQLRQHTNEVQIQTGITHRPFLCVTYKNKVKIWVDLFKVKTASVTFESLLSKTKEFNFVKIKSSLVP